jgi:hypothetical protein
MTPFQQKLKRLQTLLFILNRAPSICQWKNDPEPGFTVPGAALPGVPDLARTLQKTSAEAVDKSPLVR